MADNGTQSELSAAQQDEAASDLLKGDITSERATKTKQPSSDTASIQSQIDQARQAGSQLLRSSKKAFKKINDILIDESGEKLTGEEQEEAMKHPPRLPAFPNFMFIVAVLKDILDIPGDLSLVGIIFTTIASVTLSLIILVWTWGKMSGGWWKKKMIRWMWSRFIVSILIEFIPFIKFIPTYTIFILMAHYRETKLVRGINRVMEKIHNQKKPIRA